MEIHFFPMDFQTCNTKITLITAIEIWQNQNFHSSNFQVYFLISLSFTKHIY
jgi:hypothetical protein